MNGEIGTKIEEENLGMKKLAEKEICPNGASQRNCGKAGSALDAPTGRGSSEVRTLERNCAVLCGMVWYCAVWCVVANTPTNIRTGGMPEFRLRAGFRL